MSPLELQNEALRKWIDDILRVSGLSPTNLLGGIEAMRKAADATPHLLEALELMKATYPYSPPCFGWEEQVDAHRKAKAAIARAKGEPQ